MVGFDMWTENSVQAHMAADTPAVWRHLFPAACSYAFTETGRAVVLATALSTNAASLKTMQHMGFRRLCQVKDGHSDGVDLVLLELRQESVRPLTPRRKRHAD